jgi:hypothetical protein
LQIAQLNTSHRLIIIITTFQSLTKCEVKKKNRFRVLQKKKKKTSRNPRTRDCVLRVKHEAQAKKAINPKEEQREWDGEEEGEKKAQKIIFLS